MILAPFIILIKCMTKTYYNMVLKLFKVYILVLCFTNSYRVDYFLKFFMPIVDLETRDTIILINNLIDFGPRLSSILKSLMSSVNFIAKK